MSINIYNLANNIPEHFYVVNFNYTYAEKRDYSAIADSPYVALDTWTFYNKRHRVTAVLNIEKSSTQSGKYEGVLKISPWAWGSDNSIKVNRLGLTRPDLFKFVDYSMGTCELSFTLNAINRWELTTVKTVYYEWNEFGKQYQTINIERTMTAADTNFTLNFDKQIRYLRETGINRELVGNPPTFPETTETFDFKYFVTAAEITKVIITRYKEITAEIFDTEEVTFTLEKGTYKIVRDRVFQPINTVQRVQALDAGKWSRVNLGDSPSASLSRYKGYVFNNTYMDLNNVGDVGFQQIYGFAEADYEYLWRKVNSGNFGDIRSLKDAVFRYIPVLATLTCKKLKIRFSYVNYVAAIITREETLRGLYSPVYVNASVHNTHPWLTEIKNTYPDFIPEIFKLILIDLSANDSIQELQDTYFSEVSKFNRWIFGETTVPNLNIAKLGVTHATNIAKYLREFQEFTIRHLTADIDQALTTAYMNDVSFTGSVKINDPASTVIPGDSVTLNFLDEELIELKVMGANINVSPSSLNYNIEVKRQW